MSCYQEVRKTEELFFQPPQSVSSLFVALLCPTGIYEVREESLVDVVSGSRTSPGKVQSAYADHMHNKSSVHPVSHAENMEPMIFTEAGPPYAYLWCNHKAESAPSPIRAHNQLLYSLRLYKLLRIRPFRNHSRNYCLWFFQLHLMSPPYARHCVRS